MIKYNNILINFGLRITIIIYEVDKYFYVF